MKDICYKCGVVQEYGTMKDIDEVSFEILCNSCYNKTTIKYNTIENKRERKPHNETLNKVFVDILNSYAINWTDGTSTTKSPTGKVITYKK